MITFKEFEVWLSGGAANTDGEASLGGAISTAQRIGRQAMTYAGVGTNTGITPSAVNNMRYGEGGSFYSNNVERLVVDDTGAPPAGTNADMYWVGGSDSEAHTTADGTVTVSLLDQAIGFNTEFSVNFGTVVRNNPTAVHGGIEVEYDFRATANELWNVIPYTHYQTGITTYRCVYIKNNGATSLADFEMWFNTMGQRDAGRAFGPWGANRWVYEIGADPAGVNGTATTVANETTAPAGVTFFDAESVGLVIPTLAAGDYLAVWIKTIIPAGYAPASDFIVTATMPGYTQFYMANDLGANDTYFYISFGFDITAPAYEEDVSSDAAFTDVTVGVTDWPEDTITVTESWEGNIQMEFALEDDATISDSVAALRLVASALTDSITLTDEMVANGAFGLALVDGVVFVTFTDTAGATYEGWVLNSDTKAASMYEWAPFNSLTKFDGAYYGATADGIYQLAGDDDDGDNIDAFVLTGVDNMDIEFDKRVTRGYIGLRANGSMLLKTIVGNNVTRVYRLKSTNDAMMSRRLPLGRGVDSYYWQFGLENEKGADFELDVIRVFPVVLGRRFR